MISKFWMAIIGVIAVAIGAGVVLGPSTLGMNWSVPGTVSNEQIGNLTQKITMLEQRLDQVSKDVMNGATEKSDEIKDDMNVLEVQVKRLSDQIDDLKEKLDKTTVSSTALSAQLSKSEYKPGDTLTLSGTGLPSKSVKINLLGIDRLIISETSVTADSNGNFQYSTALSKSYASGEYSIKISQEGKVIERSFRIGTETSSPSVQPPSTTPPVQPPTTQTSSQGITISADKTQYARGDRVVVSGKTDPDVWIDVDVFDSNKVQLVRTATRSDASGNYRYDYTLPSNAALGNYEIKVTLGNKQADVDFSVIASSSGSTQTSSSSGSVTITTDKTQYSKDTLMKISGNAPAKSKVTITVDPPSGDDMLLTTTASDAGTYTTFLSIKSDAVGGSWKISVEADSYVANATVQVI